MSQNRGSVPHTEQALILLDSMRTRGRFDAEDFGVGLLAWVRHTLHVALWSVVSADTFRDAVIGAVNVEGDTDTAGAVAGARWGLSTIPREWVDGVHGEHPVGSGKIVDAAEIAARVRETLVSLNG